MQHTQALEAVRQIVRRVFAELGGQLPLEITEHILVRHDLYCGRRFSAGRFQATWFIEEDEIKIRAQDGTVAAVMSASAAFQSAVSAVRKAA
jgi:hypothetical protein